MSIQGYVLTGPETLERRELPDPEVAADEVLIRIEHAGICGSDLEYYRHFQCGAFIPREPFVPGHEFAGTVVECGPKAEGFTVGDRVACEPGVPCGRCPRCLEGRYNLCDNLLFYGTAAYYPHIDGGFRELIAVPARNALLLPEHITTAGGALVEPLAVAVHAVRRARPIDNATVLVSGCGVIGQLVAMTARAFGAGWISMSDPIASRRQFALDHGVDTIFDPLQENGQDALPARNRDGYDIVFEASGNPHALIQAFTSVRKGGRVIQIGTPPKETALPTNLMLVKEIDYRGSFRYCNDFQAALNLLAGNRIAALDIVTRTYEFSEIDAAFRDAASGEQLKVQVALPGR